MKRKTVVRKKWSKGGYLQRVFGIGDNMRQHQHEHAHEHEHEREHEDEHEHEPEPEHEPEHDHEHEHEDEPDHDKNERCAVLKGLQVGAEPDGDSGQVPCSRR